MAQINLETVDTTAPAGSASRGCHRTVPWKPIAPSGPFDTGLTAAQVLKAVKGTGFIKG